MLENLNAYVEKICFFMIAAELFVHFLPSEKYEKYMEMIAGFLCVAMFMLPVGNLLFQREDWLRMEEVERFENQLKQVMSGEEMEQAKKQYQSFAEQAESMYLEKAQIEEQLQPLLCQYEYSLQELTYDEKRDKLLFTLKKAKTNEDKIEIDSITIDGQKETELFEELKENIAKELMLDEEKIEVRQAFDK